LIERGIKHRNGSVYSGFTLTKRRKQYLIKTYFIRILNTQIMRSDLVGIEIAIGIDTTVDSY